MSDDDDDWDFDDDDDLDPEPLKDTAPRSALDADIDSDQSSGPPSPPGSDRPLDTSPTYPGLPSHGERLKEEVA